ncbi:putative carboxylesterase 18 [Camellia lanceoleosa]|uniref:Carboxylesterase 18 n=1 Tax=Camellia lanceoleosa TaxID=1840588 RepID=A0ACC0HM34_9ERIC|nr:putative carboxylesterase 18 [Camellia lanceoleosa]
MASQTKPKPALLWKIKLLLSAYAFAVNTSCRSNDTVNRHLTTFLDLKSTLSATKPIHDVTTSDTMIDSSLNLWFRLYTPTALTSTVPPSSSYHSRTTETMSTMRWALGP